MATIAGGSFPKEFNFVDNPILLGVTNFNFPESVNDAPVTFKQIVVEVTVERVTSGASYTFYWDATGKDEVWGDISSALRAVMQQWYPSPDQLVLDADLGKYVLGYATPYFKVKAWERYLVDGEEWSEEPVESDVAYAFYGGLTEYERLTILTHPADYVAVQDFPLTRKPATGELYGSGDLKSHSFVNVSSDAEGQMHYRTEMTPVADGVLEAGAYLHFMFVNSLGVLETCSAPMREAMSYSMESEQKQLVAEPSFVPRPNVTTVKSGPQAVYEMSSGIVSREWADWWVTEFLSAKRYWVRMGSTRTLGSDGAWTESPLWLPCAVTPADEETTVYDKAEQRLPHVDFDVKIAVKGSLVNQIVR